MNRIRESLAVKTAAFIIIILCAAVLVMSGIVITVNIENQWYSKDESEVVNDVANQLALDVSYTIADNIYYGYDEISETVVSDDYELFQGEAESDALGYIITSTDKNVSFGSKAKPNKKRIVNSELIKSEDALKYDFSHDNLNIQVYLDLTDISRLPVSLRSEYIISIEAYTYRNMAIAAAVAGVIAAVICFVFLMAAAGHSEKRRKQKRKSFIKNSMV